MKTLARCLFPLTLALAGCQEDAEDPSVTDTTAKHIDVVRRRLDATNAKDWTTWEGLHTPGAKRTAPGLAGPIEGASAMRAAIEELVVTFPDYHLELVDAFGESDRLVARIHTRATMQGPLAVGEATIPATGKSFEQDWIAVIRFEGDRIAEIGEFYDNYEIMIQLGVR